MHVKFDDKESGNETPEQDESVANIQVPEDTPGPDQTAEYEEIPEAEITPEAQDEVAYDEAQDGSCNSSIFTRFILIVLCAINYAYM